MLTSGYETDISADALVSALVALHKDEVRSDSGELIKTMPVKLISIFGEEREVVVMLDPEQDLYRVLADSSHILHCITPEGFKVDFISPPDAQRNEGILSAIAFVDPRAVE